MLEKQILENWKFKRQHKKYIGQKKETKDCKEKRQKTILKRFVII
jgi:hypothetical protein